MLDGGQVVSSTPAFFGANPATVLAGDRKGLRALSETEDLAKELFQSLDAEQRKTAAQEKPFPEIKEKTTAPDVGPAVGLPAKQMTEAQRTLLAKLLQSYADRMPGEVAEKEMNRVREAGMDRIHFAFSGGVVPREAYTYRLQGPTFVVEFINVQADSAGNKANHIHSCWRNLAGDFGIAAK